MQIGHSGTRKLALNLRSRTTIIFIRKNLKLLKDLGVNAYRFSLEWSRIQPEKGQWNIEAIGHYQRIIDYLRQNDIEPLLTLHHFTHPAWFIKGHP